MDESLPPGSWNLLVTRRELTFHARTVPSALHEYTLLAVWTHRSKCGLKSTELRYLQSSIQANTIHVHGAVR